MKLFAGILLVIMAALWGLNGFRSQGSVGPDNATVQAQLTAVAQSTPTPTS